MKKKFFLQLGIIGLFVVTAIGSSNSSYPSSSSGSYGGSSSSSSSYGGSSSSSKRNITVYSVVLKNGVWSAEPVSATYDSSTNMISVGSNGATPISENSTYGSSRTDGAYAVTSQYRYTTRGGYVFNL